MHSTMDDIRQIRQTQDSLMKLEASRVYKGKEVISMNEAKEVSMKLLAIPFCLGAFCVGFTIGLVLDVVLGIL
jgi:hypothetical protein